MNDSDVTMLLASLDVKSDKLLKSLEKASGGMDKHTLRMQRRAENMVKQVNKEFQRISGVAALKRGLAGLTAAGVLGGGAALVNKALESASSVGEIATQAGVSTKRLQELRFAASQTGSSFGSMDAALIMFNKNFGDLLNTGKGKLAAPFKQLGLDKLVNSGQIRDTEQAYDAYVAKVAAIGDVSQRTALLAAGFGKQAGPKMAEMVSLGIAGMEALQKQANDLGIVLSDSTVQGAKEAKDKLAALFNVLEAQGVSAVANLAPEIAKLAEDIIKGLPDLILWVERWADWFGMIQMSPTNKLKAEIADLQSEISSLGAKRGKQNWLQKWDAFGLFSFSDRDIDVLIADAKKRLTDAQSKLPGEIERPPGGKPFKLTVQGMKDFVYGKPKKRIPPTNGAPGARSAESEADRAAREARRVQDIISSTGADAVTAQAALAAATDRASVGMLKSTTDYYETVKRMVDSDLAKKLSALDAEKHAKLRHLATLEMTQQQHMEAYQNIQREFDAKESAAKTEANASLYQEMGGAEIDSRIRDLKARAAALGLTSEAADRAQVSEMALAAATTLEAAGDKEGAAALREKAAAYAKASVESEVNQEAMQNQIQIADDFRDTLAEIIVNFGDAKGALASFLQMLAKMAAMESIESIFGKRGTSLTTSGGGSSGGSGMWGDLISSAWGGIKSIAGYASGTNSAPGGIALVGEQGPELVNLPGGSSVTPTAPTLEALRGGGARVSVDNRRTVIVQGNADSAAVRQIQAHDRYLDSQLDTRIELVLARLKSGRRSIFN